MIRLLARLLAAAVLALPIVTGAANHTVAPLTTGEVRKVDKQAKKITIQHEPIQNLEMPAMTMAFHVKDPAMLSQVKAGDKVKFEAQKLGGEFTVTRIEQVK